MSSALHCSSSSSQRVSHRVSALLNFFVPYDSVGGTLQALATIVCFVAILYGFGYTALIPDISSVPHGEMWMQVCSTH